MTGSVLSMGILAGLAAAFVSVGAAAQTTGITVSATCSGGGQLCNNVATVPVSTTGLLQAEFILGSGACSSLRIHFLVDGTEVTVSGFVGAGGNTGVVNLGPVTPGNHTVGLQAEGTVGGCNSGTLGSWAGTVDIVTSASQPVPTLSAWSLAVLAALLAALGLRRTRAASRLG